APPLPHGDDERERQGEEAQPVATVLGLDLAGPVAHPAHALAGRVGDAHPRAADGDQRHRQPTARGLLLLPGGGAPLRTGAAARGTAALGPRGGSLSAAGGG